MAIRTAASIDTSTITDEQIGKCHKVFGPDNIPFYQVENSDGKLDDNGDLIEYKVTWGKDRGFSCTCKAGQFGTLCWHIKAAVACAREEKAAIAELEAAIALDAQVKKAMSDPETVKRAELAREEAPVKPVQKVKRTRANAPYQAKAFSILR